MSQNLSKKVPVILQLEPAESGAIALGMVLGFYKKWVPAEKLNLACRISKDGTAVENIVNAAKNFGMEAELKTVSFAELSNSVTFPAIIYASTGQYMVLTGIGSKFYYANSTAKGPVKIPAEQFEELFTGTVIELKPGKDFVPEGTKKDTIYYLKQSLKGNGKYIVPVMVSFILWAAAGLFFPVLTRVFTDYILPGQREDWYPGYIFIFVCLIVLWMVTSYINKLFFKRTLGAIAASSNARFMWHLLHLPMEFFSRRQAGDLAGRQLANDRVADVLIGQVAPTLTNMMMIVFYLCIMFSYSVPLSLIGIASIVLNVLTAREISKKRKQITRTQMRDQGRLDSTTVSGIDMIDTIKASGAENGFFERWSGIQASVVKARIAFAKSNMYLGAVPSLIQHIASVLILVVGLYFIINKQFTAGLLLAFQAYLSEFMTPLNYLIAAGQGIMEMSTAMERINDVMETPDDPYAVLEDDPEQLETVGKLTGNIEMKNVTYGYPGAMEPLIENFNLTLTPGKRVAFVGGSGSGKSTLAKMITGLYIPWSGEILFDGKAISEIPPSVFKSSVSLVDQDVVLFHDTVANNIKMWDETIADFEMILAARDAEIHESILERKGGYRRVIEEGGKDMSGGERQRIEIARVLAGDPSIIVMDEATAALDARTEHRVSQFIKDRGVTCVIVAHRLSTVRDCDEIIVMDHGKVVQRGTHDELISEGGFYKKLILSE